jgi:hypothetical protein
MYDVIFKTIKSGGVTSRRCDVMPCGITTLWRDVITIGIEGNPQRNHNSTKVILDGSNAGMIIITWGMIRYSFHSVGGSDTGDCWMVTWYDLRLAIGRTKQIGVHNIECEGVIKLRGICGIASWGAIFYPHPWHLYFLMPGISSNCSISPNTFIMT